MPAHPFKNRPKKLKKSVSILYHWAGAISFEDSLKAQELLKEKAQKGEFCFFGFESLSPVISMGLRADQSHILWTEKKLKAHKISLLNVKRGGEATLHAPGQLVIYPVLHLPSLGLKVKDFITALEQITQAFLTDLGISAWREGNRAGLYTSRGKLCFFGIHVSKGVSQQGLSVNVKNDLSLFQAIKSCGEAGRSHDKLSFYSGAGLSCEELFSQWRDKALRFFCL